MPKNTSKWSLLNRVSTATLLLAALSGCSDVATEPHVVDDLRRSLVCAPGGNTAFSADTVSVAPDGSCPIGFDTMVWV